MYHLTKREKTLLILLGFILAIGIYLMLILMPQLAAISSSNAELASLDTEKTTIESYLTRYGLHDQRIEELNKEIDVKLEKMLPVMEHEDLTDYILNLVGSDISVDSISISNYEVIALEAASSSFVVKLPAEYTLKEYIYNREGLKDIVKYPESYPTVFVSESNVNLEFACSKAEYVSFLDRIIEENKSIYVKDVSSTVTNGSTQYRMTIQVLGVEGLE